jgi:putative membrane protein
LPPVSPWAVKADLSHSATLLRPQPSFIRRDLNLSTQEEQVRESHVIKAGLAVTLVGVSVMTLHATKSASEEKDRRFVDKVSQGVLYKVEAGKVAAAHAKSPMVKTLGVLESRDNQNVNRKLKAIADATEVTIEPELNEEFAERLEKLKAVPPAEFDDYYVADMKQIHAEDEGLCEQEAQDGSGTYKPFASETAELVKEQLDRLAAL